jgi:hypothetical protein
VFTAFPRDPVGHSVRTLPIKLAPAAGESVDSWLEAVALRYNTAFGLVVEACGITAARPTRSAWLGLPESDLDSIGAAMGVDPERVRELTLERYRDILAPEGDWRRVKSALWIRNNGSRFCPDCLRDSGGRWQLGWRFNWNFACGHHRCLLATSCPRCHNPQRRNVAHTRDVPRPGIACDRRTCEATLVGDVEAVGKSLLLAQQQIVPLLEGRGAELPLYCDAPQSPLGVLADLKLFTHWIVGSVDQTQLDLFLPTDLAAATARHRRTFRWPHGPYWRSARFSPSALDVAGGASVAFKVLAAEDVSIAIQVLRQLMQTSADVRSYPPPLADQRYLTPALRAVHAHAVQPVRANRKVLNHFRRAAAKSSAKPVEAPRLCR